MSTGLQRARHNWVTELNWNWQRYIKWKANVSHFFTPSFQVVLQSYPPRPGSNHSQLLSTSFLSFFYAHANSATALFMNDVVWLLKWALLRIVLDLLFAVYCSQLYMLEYLALTYPVVTMTFNRSVIFQPVGISCFHICTQSFLCNSTSAQLLVCFVSLSPDSSPISLFCFIILKLAGWKLSGPQLIELKARAAWVTWPRGLGPCWCSH